MSLWVQIYRNISFTELGTLLGIRPEKAEQMTAGMISEERMQGRIDQLSGFVHFGGTFDFQRESSRLLFSVSNCIFFKVSCSSFPFISFWLIYFVCEVLNLRVLTWLYD